MVIERTVKLLYGVEKTKVEKTLIFKEISYETAKQMVITNHYSHKWNTSFGKINVGVFEKGNDTCLGVASYGNLMNPNSYKSISDSFESNSIIELNRLWVDDCLGGNTESILMKASFDIIRKLYPHIKAVQSFADGRLGCGTIYKAMNFNYYGFEESLFYEHLDGTTYHKVPMENTMRPDGMIKLNTMYINGELKPFKVKTYRYIYPLYKDVHIKLEQQEYPKYDIGLTYLEDYKHNPNLIIRSWVLAYILNYPEFESLDKYVLSNLLQEKDLILTQFENKSIIKICEERNCIDRHTDFMFYITTLIQ